MVAHMVIQYTPASSSCAPSPTRCTAAPTIRRRGGHSSGIHCAVPAARGRDDASVGLGTGAAATKSRGRGGPRLYRAALAPAEQERPRRRPRPPPPRVPPAGAPSRIGLHRGGLQWRLYLVPNVAVGGGCRRRVHLPPWLLLVLAIAAALCTGTLSTPTLQPSPSAAATACTCGRCGWEWGRGCSWRAGASGSRGDGTNIFNTSVQQPLATATTTAYSCGRCG